MNNRFSMVFSSTRLVTMYGNYPGIVSCILKIILLFLLCTFPVISIKHILGNGLQRKIKQKR
jgi:hypothetical protein